MIIKILKAFLQNVHKNRLLTDTLLENNKDINIIFIQELSWSFICSILCSMSEKEEIIVGIPNYSSYIMFARTLNITNEYPRVLIYINARLTRLCFSPRKYIYNHRDINLISFFNCSYLCFLIKIYLDNYKSILEYFKDPKANLNNVLIMTEDFNIRNNDWDLLYPHYSTHTDILREIADSFNLELSVSIEQMPTYCTNNLQDSNSVIDLMFLYTNLEELKYHVISSNIRRPSDYAPLFIHIIKEKFI